MSTYIVVPAANLQNIAIFPDEPGNAVVDEIKTHVRAFSSPHTWRGHSHTKPPVGAFPVYIDEFDVPAPDTVRAVAPCPCCNPHHPQYKHKGKIAWFPNENVVRLIGPDCFRAINAEGHDDALIKLRIRQKRRAELATVSLHTLALRPLIDVLSEALPIAEALDEFQRELNRVIDNHLNLNLWREVKGGDLNITVTRKVAFRKEDGSIGERSERTRTLFGRIKGQSMIDRSGQFAAGRLGPLRAGLIQIADRVDQVAQPDDLTDVELESFGKRLVGARQTVMQIFQDLRERQEFLTSNAIDELARWGQHEGAPVRFSIVRRKADVILAAMVRPSRDKTTCYVPIGSAALQQIPEIATLQN